MNILVSNDDGIDAAGLKALAHALAPLGRVWVVAPSTEQSAKSHSITMHSPLRIRRRGAEGTFRFSVDGTPADCMYIALHHLLPKRPDLVISGINHGANLGADVFYSGTVAAAREAALAGVPALAVSLSPQGDGELDFDHAAMLATQLAPKIAHAGGLFNLNVPNTDQVRGLRATRLGARQYEPLVDERRDPRGKRYVWIGGPPMPFGTNPEHDGDAVSMGYASLSALSLDATDTDKWELVRSICDE